MNWIELYSDITTDLFFYILWKSVYTYALATHVTYILLLPVLLLSSKYHWKLKQELTFRRKFLFIWFKQGHNFLLRFYHAIFMTWDNALNLFQFRLSVSTYTNSEWANIKKGTTNFRVFPPLMKCSELFFMSVHALNSSAIHIIIKVYLHLKNFYVGGPMQGICYKQISYISTATTCISHKMCTNPTKTRHHFLNFKSIND